MYHRFLVGFIGFILGCGVMAIIYDIKLIEQDLGFMSQLGMHPQQAIVFKIVLTLFAFVGTVAVVILKPKEGL